MPVGGPSSPAISIPVPSSAANLGTRSVTHVLNFNPRPLPLSLHLPSPTHPLLPVCSTSTSAPPIPPNPRVPFIVDALAHQQTVQIDDTSALNICELILSLGTSASSISQRTSILLQNANTSTTNPYLASAPITTHRIPNTRARSNSKMSVTDVCFHQELASTIFIHSRLGSHTPIP
jgi:hypothetical protein